jgi:hypothetical protein
MAYIDRDKAIAYVEEQYRLFDNDESKQAIVEGCVEAVKFTPTADVVKVKHGEWTHTDKADRWHSKDECSECHYHTFDRIDLTHFNYCPNCGAKMDGGKAE